MYFASSQQMEKLDTLAVKNGLEIRQMMELAGFHMSILFHMILIPKTSRITVVVGKGNKGGDGLSAARHIINHGWKNTSVILLTHNIKKDPKHHLSLLKKMRVPIFMYQKNTVAAKKLIQSSDILIDSLIGYQLNGVPKGDYADVISQMNKSRGKIISYDMPTGIDATRGTCYTPCIRAFATLTLALPKKLFRIPQAKKLSGKIFLGDIGIPKFLYDKIEKGSQPNFSATKNGLLVL